MEILIPLAEGCGVFEPLANGSYVTTKPAEQLECAADFITALVKNGGCKFYETETGGWVLEVRLPSTLRAQIWIH